MGKEGAEEGGEINENNEADEEVFDVPVFFEDEEEESEPLDEQSENPEPASDKPENEEEPYDVPIFFEDDLEDDEPPFDFDDIDDGNEEYPEPYITNPSSGPLVSILEMPPLEADENEEPDDLDDDWEIPYDPILDAYIVPAEFLGNPELEQEEPEIEPESAPEDNINPELELPEQPQEQSEPVPLLEQEEPEIEPLDEQLPELELPEQPQEQPESLPLLELEPELDQQPLDELEESETEDEEIIPDLVDALDENLVSPQIEISEPSQNQRVEKITTPERVLETKKSSTEKMELKEEKEEAKTKIIYETKNKQKTWKIFSDGLIELQEEKTEPKLNIPINIRLWNKMNKEKGIKSKINLEFTSKEGRKEKIKEVPVTIFSNKYGIFIKLPYEGKGAKARKLLKENVGVKVHIPNLFEKNSDILDSVNFRERLKILLKILENDLVNQNNFAINYGNQLQNKIRIKREENHFVISIGPSLKDAFLISDSEKEIIYEDIEQKRSSKVTIFLDGTITFTTNRRYSTFWVPKRLNEWKSLPKELGDSIIVDTKVKILNGINKGKIIEMKALIYATRGKIKLKPISDLIVEELKSYDNETTFEIEIPGQIDNIEQIPVSEKFKQAKLLLKKADLSGIENATLIAIYEQLGLQFKLYMSENGSIYLMQKGRLRRNGRLRLSPALKRYIENFTETELVIASLNSQKPIVLKAKSRYDKNGQFVKNIQFPIKQDQITEAEILVTSPNWKLKNDYKLDLKLKNMLKQIGLNIDFLTSNVDEEGLHIHPNFEFLFKELLNKSLENKNATILSEVEIWSRDYKQERIVREKNKTDVMVIPSLKIDNRLPVLIIEIKSSKGQSRHKHIREGIFEIKHLHRKLGKQRILPVVVINTDRKIANRNLTIKYGIVNGVLLIGKESLKNLQRNSNDLLKIIQEIQNEIELLEQNPEITIHPLTGELISIDKLHKEAFKVLLKIITSKLENSTSTSKLEYKYSRIMNIPLELLNKYINTLMENGKIDLGNLKTSDVYFIHKTIATEKIAILVSTLKENDKDLATLIKNKHIIQKFIPLRIKLVNKKHALDLGSDFENEILKELENKELDIISNIIFSNSLFDFEIDHLILQDTGITPVSCKNHSRQNNSTYLIDEIRDDANELEHLIEMLHAEKGILFVKVPWRFRESIKERFENLNYKNVEIIFK